VSDITHQLLAYGIRIFVEFFQVRRPVVGFDIVFFPVTAKVDFALVLVFLLLCSFVDGCHARFSARGYPYKPGRVTRTPVAYTIVRVSRVNPVVTAPRAPVAAAPDQNAAVLAGFLGWTLDAFDYFLVVYCLTAIGKEFHRSDAEMALAITVTLVLRPVGAFLFGLMADRYGRRLPLMLDLVFYSVVEIATAFSHSYTSFLILRALFGIGMGGEWGVGASLAMEKVSPRFRGLISGLLQQGYAAGNLLAALCYFFLFDRVGWRPLFLLGGLPALLAIFVRMRVKESEAWEKTRKPDWSQLRVAILSNWKLFLYLVLLMTFMNFSSHGTQDLYPTFLQRYWHFDASRRALLSVIAGVGALFGGTAIGYYSDFKGRRRAIVTGLLLAVAVIPLWALAPNVALLCAGAFLMQFMVQGAWGVIPAHLSELSPDAVRGFLPGFAYQCGVLFSASIAYIQAVFAEHFSYATTMALSAGLVFVVGSIVAGLGKERHGRIFGEDG
jgi:MFS transporter, SHS family, lactate transporter